MYVNSLGQGKDLVLLHGWAMHGGVFDSLIKELIDNYRVHVIDIPGFGLSREDQSRYNLEQLSELIIERLRVLKCQNVIFIAWSLGGLIAQNICIREPSLVSKLVLIASVPKFVYSDDWQNGISDTVLNIFHESMQQDYRKTVLRFLSLQVLGDELAMLQLRLLRQEIFSRGEPNPDALVSGLKILQQTDLRSSIGQIKQACLFIAGSQDQIVLVNAIRDSVLLYQNARYHIIEKSAHALFLSHQPQFLKLLNEFLNEK